MRKKNYKGRCEKRMSTIRLCSVSYVLQMPWHLGTLLSDDAAVKEIRCNVPMDGSGYTSDIVCTLEDGRMIVFECCYRNILKRPTTAKLLQQSRGYWLGHGVGEKDWRIAVDAEK